MTRYIGVDPGLITGIAVYEAGLPYFARELTRGEVMPFLRLYIRKGDVCIVERYTISASTVRKTRQNDAMQISGAVKELCREVGAICMLQEPAPAKRIGSDIVLKTLDWFYPTPDGHANDGGRLVLMGLLKHRASEYAALVGL